MYIYINQSYGNFCSMYLYLLHPGVPIMNTKALCQTMSTQQTQLHVLWAPY